MLTYRLQSQFFSVTFGLCGIAESAETPCDFTPEQRQQLGSWFRQESVTKTWIRATSPKTNCSKTTPLPLDSTTKLSDRHSDTSGADEKQGGEYPAFPTCAAGRPDHGSNGAYPSWPAFAIEALCYVDGNCTSAFSIMSTFADNTYEGAFGQAHQVPQMSTPPYTPINDVSAFKPIAGVTRYIAIEGGSFFDATLRGLFGYHAPVQWLGGKPAQEQLTATLHNPTVPRGFVGELRNLRTPLGLATLKSTAAGTSLGLQ